MIMIGIFDSGSGGLSVLRELRKRAPNADVVYFGDLENAPYGNKSREELGILTMLGIERLIKEGATEIISACNSVSVSIVLPMFEILDLPRTNIIEMVGPTISSFKMKSSKILLLSTVATAESGVYQEGFRMINTESEVVSIPELVSLIESGADEKVLTDVVRRTLTPYTKQNFTDIVLGCTHYPLVESVFENVVNEIRMKASIVNPAVCVAGSAIKQFSVDGEGRTRFVISEESTVFRHFAEKSCEDNLCSIEVK